MAGYIPQLSFLFPKLPGSLVRFRESDYIVEESSEGFVKLVEDGVDEEPARARVRPLVALQAYMKKYKGEHKVTKKGGSRYKLTEVERGVAKCVAERFSDWEARRTEGRRLVQNAVSNVNREEPKLAKHDAKQVAIGEQLPGHGDTFTRKTLVDNLEAARFRLHEQETTLDEINEQGNYMFDSVLDIVKCFKETFDVVVPASTIYGWINKGFTDADREPGRPILLSKEAEAELIKTVLYLDSCAFPMGSKAIRELAAQMCTPDVRARFAQVGPSEGWFQGFIRRHKRQHPDLVLAASRGADCHTTKWFNTDMVHWWFAKFKEIVLEHKFAYEDEDGELQWTDAGRVLLTDETCVNGGKSRTTTSGKSKVVTTADRCEISDSGQLSRRTCAQRDFEDHITLIGGLTALGHITPPAWIFTCATEAGLSDSSLRLLRSMAPKYPQLEPCNGHKLMDPIIDHGPRGGVTGTNIQRVMKKIFEQACPGFNKDNKLLWMTDAGPGRMDLEFITWMRDNGVVLIHWLPNSTSIMQPADVRLFGAFKSVLERMRKAWKANPLNLGKRIDRYVALQLAGKAMIESFTRSKMMQALEETGMVPITPTPLLQHPRIHDGDNMRALREQHAAQVSASQLQKAPSVSAPASASASASASSSTPSPASASASTPDMQYAVLSESAQREAHTQRAFESSILIQKTRLGEFRTLVDDVAKSDELTMQTKTECLREIQGQILDRTTSLPTDMAKLRDALQQQADDADNVAEAAATKAADARRRAMELRMAIDGSVQTSTCEREQEVGYLNVFQQQLQSIEEANPSSAQTLGIVSMKLNDLRECERDDYGIVVGVGDAKLQRNPPTISATPGVVTEVLQQRVDLATEGLARNAGLSSGARQVSDLTRDGHTPMVFGPLLHATGSIEGSSGAMEELARKHASRSKRTREDAIVRDGAHKRRKEDRRKSFPHRLLKASDAMASKGEQVGVCGEYVSRLKEQAELDEAPKEEKKRLLLISKNKGQELVAVVRPLFTTTRHDAAIAGVAAANLASAAADAAAAVIASASTAAASTAPVTTSTTDALEATS